MREPIEVLVPQMNPNDEHAVLVCWHIDAGKPITRGDPLATLETTKSTFDVEAPRDGYVFYEAAPKTLMAVGSRLAWICDENVAPSPASMRDTAAEPVTAAEEGITRKAARLMREHGLRPSDFDFGVSPGRIEVADVERVLRDRAGGRVSPALVAPQDCTPLEQSPAKMIEIQSLGEVYRSAIPSMVALSLSGEKAAARLRALAKKVGPVSLLEVVIFESARLLVDFPDLNGYYAQDKAWQYATVAVGFAINLGRSLRVPVVHHAATLSEREIAQVVRDLSLRYLRDELQLADLTGGTFTVTDLSSHGVEHFVPVLNLRQSAILGICAERTVGRRELVMTFDHRMTDGMRAGTFLTNLRERLETLPPD
jgi:pyruvate/2-oxoglutarate dehydrogenase complex dihydrolipoamide acyltransferase (E2) component